MNLQGIYTDLVAAAPPKLNKYTSVPNSPDLPAVYCGPPNSMSDFSSYGSCLLQQTITICVSRANEDTAQFDLVEWFNIDTLARFLQAKSENWSDMALISVDNFRSVTFGTIECLAGDINLSIRTT